MTTRIARGGRESPRSTWELLNVAFTAAVRERSADTDVIDPRKYLAPARDAIADTVIALLVPNGRAVP